MNGVDLAQYGVAIFAIGTLGYTVHLFTKFVGNHIGTSTKASQKLADAISQMLRFLERSGK